MNDLLEYLRVPWLSARHSGGGVLVAPPGGHTHSGQGHILQSSTADGSLSQGSCVTLGKLLYTACVLLSLLIKIKQQFPFQRDAVNIK